MTDITVFHDYPPPVPLEHRKSTAKEGWRVLAGTVFTVAAFVAFGAFIFPDVRPEGWAILLASVIAGTFILAVMLYAVANIRAGSEFSCRLDEERFTCVSPVDACGDSFDLPLDQIAKIEREDWSEGDCRWYVWDAEGKRYWLTSNYNNPDGQFIANLQLLRPDIERVDT